MHALGASTNRSKVKLLDVLLLLLTVRNALILSYRRVIRSAALAFCIPSPADQLHHYGIASQ
jgi:hypothetical protein